MLCPTSSCLQLTGNTRGVLEPGWDTGGYGGLGFHATTGLPGAYLMIRLHVSYQCMAGMAAVGVTGTCKYVVIVVHDV